MVVGVIALVAALAGTAVAADPMATIGAPNRGEAESAAKKKRKQVRRIARKVANKRITKRAPGLSVASANSATSAANAFNAGALGGKTRNQLVMWAVVGSTGSVGAASDPRVTSTRIDDPGRYRVTFPIDVSDCGYQVTPKTGAVNTSPRVVMGVGRIGGSPNQVSYVIGDAREGGTAALRNSGANVAVFC